MRDSHTCPLHPRSSLTNSSLLLRNLVQINTRIVFLVANKMTTYEYVRRHGDTCPPGKKADQSNTPSRQQQTDSTFFNENENAPGRPPRPPIFGHVFTFFHLLLLFLHEPPFDYSPVAFDDPQLPHLLIAFSCRAELAQPHIVRRPQQLDR